MLLGGMRTSFFSRVRFTGLIVIVSLLMAGCISSPRQEVRHHGQLPSPGAFVFSGIELGERPAELTVGLGKALEARGFQETDRPRYLVQVARSDRPGNVGLSVPEAVPAAAGAFPKSGNRASRRTERIRQLTLSINSASDGQELYRLQGSEVYRPGKADDGGVRLANAMMAHIAGQ